MDDKKDFGNRKRPVKKGTVSPVYDGMGKLPPQAIDMEEVVLGAILLEKDALSKVKDVLKDDYFYKEAHQKIYNAIVQLDDGHDPIDILTVTQWLKKKGELDVCGGPFYISQLTNRVASSANIETHSRTIIEKFLQREIIRIGADAVKTSYEDTTDVLQELDEVKTALEKLTSNVISGAKIITVDMVPGPRRNILTIRGRRLLSIGNFAILIAPPGSGKSNVCEAIAASYVDPECDALGFEIEADKEKHPDGVLYVDTERSWDDSSGGMCRIKDRIDLKLKPHLINNITREIIGIRFLNLVGVGTVRDCRLILEGHLRRGKFRMVILDGITDFVNNVNDPEESSAFLKWLRSVCVQVEIGAFVTIHNNVTGQATEKGRGHTGSELHRRGESQMMMKKDEEDKRKRYISFDFHGAKNRNDSDAELRQYFEWDDALHRFVSVDYEPQKKPPRGGPEDKMDNIFKQIFATRQIYAGQELVDKYMEMAKVSESTAWSHIKKAVKDGMLFKNEENNSYRRDKDDIPF